MHVLNGWHYLEWKVFPSLLTNAEIASFEVIEHVLASHVIKDQVVVVRVLEQVDELDDVRVLAHFEDLYLASLLVHLNRLHVLLFDDLDGNLDAWLLMVGEHDFPELALPQNVT